MADERQAGGALAAALHAPLLLSEAEGLPPAVAGGLADRAPGRVTLVGGESALGRAVEFRLRGRRRGGARRGSRPIGTSFAAAARARDHGAGLGRVWAAGASATTDQLVLVASSAAGATGTAVVLISEDPRGLAPRAAGLVRRAPPAAGDRGIRAAHPSDRAGPSAAARR